MKLKPSSRVKHHIQREPCIMKKQRSKRPFRVRSQISPILLSNNLTRKKNKGVSVNSTSHSHFGDEVSCNSSRVTVESNPRKRKLEDSSFRRITRAYYKQKERERRACEVELSESSCVEESHSRFKEIQVNDASTFSSLHKNLNSRKIPLEIKEDDAISVASGVDSCLSHKTTTNKETEFSEISKNDAVSVNECVVEQQKPPNSLGGEGENDDLACTEELYVDDGVSEYSSCQETAFSGMQSEIFPEKYSSDDLCFSDDYTPSIFFESGSEFSEKSVSDSNPSQTYSLLLQFRQQFSRSSLPLETRKSSALEVEYQENSTFATLEDEEDEESYKRLRERERRQLFLHDYPESYRTTTEHGDLILQQRLQMVHWIIEQSTTKEFELATMFLGISLLDRFLTKGFFKNKRHLQIVGIACLSLATRIEENQPYNCVRQKNFYIGNNVYSRCEVVAMEWLVQEVLNFRCFLPTIHNFMWFYLKAIKADAVVEKRARYLAVLALSDHEQLRHWPSTVAATLVILASLESNEIVSYGRVIEVHVRTNENDLHECIKSLEWLLQYMD
ncbi:unnamed protein product [Dovyalis caffra]|uniref:B-like cyclin n=1 Tax=Dovyalis caffra TaxID=77055 RepID=A0AAV1R1B2_9ROSI|nr:unnamed protein product [Dovyalis caffra]